VQALPTEKITKKPIPEEHLILKTTFEDLIQRCLSSATDPVWTLLPMVYLTINTAWGWRVGSALSILQRAWVSFPAPTWQLTAVCNSTPRTSEGTAHMWHTDMQGNACILKTVKYIF
jgi:hypothetical protein